jgi:aspartate aminotransferase-like enzyme
MIFKKKYPYRLLTPGPVPLHPDVQQILSEPMIHHRTPEFERCLRSVCERLKDTFATQESVYIHASTGTGAMESAIVNTLSPGDKALCIVSGKFGERWAQMCKIFGVEVITHNVEWGEAVNAEDVARLLRAHPDIKAVLTQACETSTATVHPVRELSTLIREKSDTLLMIDAITAVGAMELEMDQWGLDVVIGGSQKAFMLPTGLSFIALSHKARRFAERSRIPKFYFDLKLEQKALAKGETHFSSVVPLIRALDISLNYLTGDAKKRTLSRIEKLAEATRAAAPALGLSVFSKSPSPSVTALVVPPNIDSQKLRDHIEEKYNLTLMGGQDQLKGKILRIGHLGYITNDDMLALFEILALALRDFGYADLKKSAREEAQAIIKKHLAN